MPFPLPQVLLMKNPPGLQEDSGDADLNLVAIHLYHPDAPASQNNLIVTPVHYIQSGVVKTRIFYGQADCKS